MQYDYLFVACTFVCLIFYCYIFPINIRTLWNFSPKALFTDRSGMYWRQRRLSPGIFTDGNKVYETTYHYSEGRNGMKVVSESLEEYIQKNPDISKEKLLEKMNGGTKPDFVLEY